MNRVCIVLGWALMLGVTSTVMAVTPALMVDRELHTQRVVLQGISDGVVSYFGPDRQMRSKPISRVIQLRFLDHQQEPPTEAKGPAKTGQGYIRLVDGQRLYGHWEGPGTEGESIRWRHPLLGNADLPLDQVESIVFGAHAPTADTVDGHDTLRLSNGDVVVGFVVAVDQGGIRIIPTGRDQDLLVALGRVLAVRLSNKRAHHQRRPHRLWLSDGSRVHAESFDMVGGEVTIHAAPLFSSSLPTTFPLNKVDRVDLAADGAHVVDLSELPMRTVSGGRVFGVLMMPTVRDGLVRLHAPVVVEFDLPPGASMFAARAMLDLGQPGQAPLSPWPDLELSFSSQREQITSLHLNSKHPSADINTPLSGPTLTIEASEGLHGPVLDRLRLEDAVVLIRVD